MFRRSFKPDKCKEALKLSYTRIKLCIARREAKIKQMKMELSTLLQNGQHQTASIRVKDFVHEQKRIEAYEIIQISCELIAARMILIQSHKNCPIDLKEAISCVIYASVLCKDIPELMDVRMHLTSKYGEKFVSDACGLRPDCGVNSMLIEKFFNKAPDAPTKIKVLLAIAEEHNIKWEPNHIGPSTLENDAYVESEVHPPPVHDAEVSTNSCASSQLEPMHDSSTHSFEQNASAAAREATGNHSTTSGIPNVEIKSSDSDSCALVAESQETTSTHEPQIQNEKSETKKKSRSWASVRYFDSDGSDSEDGLHKQNSASVARPIRRIPQQT